MGSLRPLGGFPPYASDSEITPQIHNWEIQPLKENPIVDPRRTMKTAGWHKPSRSTVTQRMCYWCSRKHRAGPSWRRGLGDPQLREFLAVFPPLTRPLGKACTNIG
jgi:hypothetical protein